MVVLDFDSCIELTRLLYEAISPAISKVVKLNTLEQPEPYASQVLFDFDASKVTRSDRVKLQRNLIKINYCYEALAHYMEFFDYKLYSKSK